MDRLEKFLRNMRGIYAGMTEKQETALKAGLLPDPVLQNHRGGYFVALRLEPGFVRLAEQVTERIRKTVPSAVVYDASMLHTTIAVYGQVDGFDPAPEERTATVQKIAGLVDWLLPQLRPVACTYGGVVFDQVAAIAKGIPDDSFFVNAGRITEALTKDGIAVKLPWGAHVTLSRFTEAHSAEIAGSLQHSLIEPASDLRNYTFLHNRVAVGSFSATSTAFNVSLDREFLVS